MARTQTKPIELHYWPTPNGWKINIYFEEAGIPYDIKYVNDYTDNAASLFFKVASIWAGQPG